MTLIHPLIIEELNFDGRTDPWGRTLEVLGALCDVLTLTWDSDLIPASVGYRPAMGLDWDYLSDDEGRLARTFFRATYLEQYGDDFIDMAELTTDDIAYAIGVLDRYCDRLVLAGLDY